MKRKILNILTVSSIITTISLVMDGDPVEPSMLMRFVEFFLMSGIIFLLVSFVYFTTTFIFKNIKRV
jgi:hypothetical protein